MHIVEMKVHAITGREIASLTILPVEGEDSAAKAEQVVEQLNANTWSRQPAVNELVRSLRNFYSDGTLIVFSKRRA